jgi:prepilin-type N-terminal cleavage/methylation domain-containing protein
MRTLSTNSVAARRPARRAFTFVELMVVTLLIALLAGSSIRGSVATFRKMQVERAAREVFLSAQFARIQAVESQRSALVTLDPKTRSLAVTAGGKGGQQLVRNAYTRPYQFAEEVNYERIDITPTRPSDSATQDETPSTVITFRPDGSADGAVVQVGNGKTHWTVYISSATGSARAEQGAANEQSPTMAIDLDKPN